MASVVLPAGLSSSRPPIPEVGVATSPVPKHKRPGMSCDYNPRNYHSPNDHQRDLGMREVNRHVEWGRRREPSIDACRSGGGRVKRKWSTVKLRGIIHQDGELPMRPMRQAQSAEDNDKVPPRSVLEFTPSPEFKGKTRAPLNMYRNPESVPEQAPIRNRREDSRLHEQVVNEAAKTAARVESCNNETLSTTERFESPGAIKAKSIVYSSPRYSPYIRNLTPGSSKASGLYSISSPLLCLGSDSDDDPVRSTRRDWCEDATPPLPALTSVRTSREANDTTFNHSERVTGLSEELEMCERAFCFVCGTVFSNASSLQVCTECDSVGTVNKTHLVAPDGTKLESSINCPEIRDEAIFWSEKEDSKLLTLKNTEVSWVDIASVLEKDQGECKQRFKTIKPKNWKPRRAEEKEPRSKSAGRKKGPVSTAGVAGGEASAGRMEDTNRTYLSAMCGLVSGGCDFPKDSSEKDGWGEASVGGWGDEPVPYKPCRVTYWANVESGTSVIRIPIDSKYVAGPEKIIATKGLPKVWKWVHDKGLGDKVGLQDAFDLTRSVHKNDADDGDSSPMGHRPYSSFEVHMKQGNPWAPWVA